MLNLPLSLKDFLSQNRRAWWGIRLTNHKCPQSTNWLQEPSLVQPVTTYAHVEETGLKSPRQHDIKSFILHFLHDSVSQVSGGIDRILMFLTSWR